MFQGLRLTSKGLARLGFAWVLMLSACKNLEDFQDRQIKGVLTVDKSAAGNAYLEVWDTELKDYRMLHPGRKIIEIDSGLRSIVIRIFDSRRVLLSTIRVPKSKVQFKNSQLFVSGMDMGQGWDLVGRSVSTPLTTEHYATRDSRSCGSSGGLAGVVWQVVESQSEYIVEFRNLGSEKVWGQLRAKSEMQVSAHQVDLGRQCHPKRVVHREAQELFQ